MENAATAWCRFATGLRRKFSRPAAGIYLRSRNLRARRALRDAHVRRPVSDGNSVHLGVNRIGRDANDTAQPWPSDGIFNARCTIHGVGDATRQSEGPCSTEATA